MKKGNKTSFKKWKKKWKRRFRIMKLFKSHIGKILPIILLIVCRKLLRELNKWQKDIIYLLHKSGGVFLGFTF